MKLPNLYKNGVKYVKHPDMEEHLRMQSYPGYNGAFLMFGGKYGTSEGTFCPGWALGSTLLCDKWEEYKKV